MVFYNVNSVSVDKDTFNNAISFCRDNSVAYDISEWKKSNNYYHYIIVSNDVLIVVLLKNLIELKAKWVRS